MAETENEIQQIQETTQQINNPVEEAKKVLAAIEEQNRQLVINLNRAEQLKVNDILGGSSFAGQQQAPPKTQNDLDNEQARAMLEGTGYEDIKLD